MDWKHLIGPATQSEQDWAGPEAWVWLTHDSQLKVHSLASSRTPEEQTINSCVGNYKKMLLIKQFFEIDLMSKNEWSCFITGEWSGRAAWVLQSHCVTCRSSPLSSHETDTLRRSRRARPGPRYSDRRRTALTVYCVGAECMMFVCFWNCPQEASHRRRPISQRSAITFSSWGTGWPKSSAPWWTTRPCRSTPSE